MLDIILLNKAVKDKPHLLVTIKSIPNGEEKVIRCVDFIYNVKCVALLGEDDDPIFFSNRNLYDVVNVKPVE